MDMPDSGRRLFNFEPDSSPYEMYIGEVDREIDDVGAKFRKKLAVLAGITEDELRNLLKSYSTAEIEAAIAERDQVAAAKSQPGITNPSKPRDTRISRLIKWEEDKDMREEALRESIGNK